jgi:DNA-binding PadR family transcriptional regulator
MCSYWLDLSIPAHRILYKFGLSARGKTELEILKNLSKGSANVYELKWKRLRDIDVHYSTVLRALRRLEKKKLVRVVSQRDSGHRGKTYACTLLGNLVVALTKKGLSGAAKIVAENSRSFRECIRIHLSFDSDYPSIMMESVILKILNTKS